LPGNANSPTGVSGSGIADARIVGVCEHAPISNAATATTAVRIGGRPARGTSMRPTLVDVLIRPPSTHPAVLWAYPAV